MNNDEQAPVARRRVRTKSPDQLLQARVNFIIAVVHKAIQKCSGVDMATWTQNCGRRVSHHSGFLALVQILGFVQMLNCTNICRGMDF